MHLLLPLGLLLLAAWDSKKQPAAAARPAPQPPTPRRPPQPKPQPSAAAKPKPKITIDHPNVVPGREHEQAAVDAAVSQAIRDMPPPAPAPAAQPGPVPTPPPAPVDAEVVRTPKEAAQGLLKFLIDTGRFGTKTNPVPEVAEAQRNLGVKADGIVGPKTRAAAKAQGVALPPRK